MADADVTALFTEAQRRAPGRRACAAIATALPPRSPWSGLLKGSFVFVADLARALSKAGCSPRIEFMRVSSYGERHHQLRHRQPDGRCARRREGRARAPGRRHPGHRPDPGLHPRVPARARRRPGSGPAPCSTSRRAARSRPARSTSSASRSRTCSWSATASTTPSATASCPSSLGSRAEAHPLPAFEPWALQGPGPAVFRS